ncbi:MAG: hypothetical protein KGK10_08095 [Rhodospirillales bacterium]|nr:hypothetical protein [Rhodospirillales bacterium]
MFAVAPRRGEALRQRSQRALPTPLPECGRTLFTDGLRTVCVRPDQWLVLGEGTAEWLGALLAEAFGDAANMVDVSGAYVGMRVRGAGSRAALGKFLPLDLHPRAMQAGHAAATLAAHLPVLLWQADDMPTYELLCTRSYAASFRRTMELIGVF